MADPIQRFTVVGEDDEGAGLGVKTPVAQERATDLILMMLQTFSKRVVLALESCFSLITVGLVFVVAYPILTAAPTPNQLIGLGIFSVFVLIGNLLVLKRRQ